jgi:hypothetical protein
VVTWKKMVIVDVVVHAMLADRARCVWNLSTTTAAEVAAVVADMVGDHGSEPKTDGPTGITPKGALSAFEEKASALQKHLVFRLTQLAMQWVTREAGLMLDGTTVRLMWDVALKKPPPGATTQVPVGFDGASSARLREPLSANAEAAARAAATGLPTTQEEMAKFFEEALKKLEKDPSLLDRAAAAAGSAGAAASSAAGAPSGAVPTSDTAPHAGDSDDDECSSAAIPSSLRSKLNFSANQTTTAAKRGPLVQEVAPAAAAGGGVIKRGFLNAAAKEGKLQLYGPEGSAEGTAAAAAPIDPMHDPSLAHLPPALRAKAKIVDARGATTAADLEKLVSGAAGTAGNQTSDGGRRPQHADDTASLFAAPRSITPPRAIPTHHVPASSAAATSAAPGPSSLSSGPPVAAGSRAAGPAAAATPTPTPADNSQVQAHAVELRCDVAPGWTITSATVNTTPAELVLAVKVPPTVTSMKQLDLEVLPFGIKCGVDATANGGSTTSCFSFEFALLGGATTSGFGAPAWAALARMLAAAGASGRGGSDCVRAALGATAAGRLALDVDGAGAKYKKALAELHVTVPMIEPTAAR